MGNPHRKDRYGEVWTQDRIDAYLESLTPLRGHIVLSGGFAWHFMSPRGHKELKHAHDHKDADIFVDPADIGTVMAALVMDEFQRVPCRWTGNEFWRYEKRVERDGKRHKLVIDFFLDTEGLPTRVLEGGWTVVEPVRLLAMYSVKHTSRECFAVTAARKLVAAGVDPVGRQELVTIPVD